MWLSTLEIGAAQPRSVTEIALKSPFLCVNRNPIWYGFRAGTSAIWYIANLLERESFHYMYPRPRNTKCHAICMPLGVSKFFWLTCCIVSQLDVKTKNLVSRMIQRNIGHSHFQCTVLYGRLRWKCWNTLKTSKILRGDQWKRDKTSTTLPFNYFCSRVIPVVGDLQMCHSLVNFDILGP